MNTFLMINFELIILIYSECLFLHLKDLTVNQFVKDALNPLWLRISNLMQKLIEIFFQYLRITSMQWFVQIAIVCSIYKRCPKSKLAENSNSRSSIFSINSFPNYQTNFPNKPFTEISTCVGLINSTITFTNNTSRKS